MCQILNINPGVTVPFDQLALTCDINKHGFGLSWVEGGEIKIVRSTKQPNDPEEIHKLLESKKKFRRFLHVRHATVGAVNLENSHPFVLLAKGRKNYPTLCMMHNGTFGNFLPPKDDLKTSDTLLFAKYLAAPLAARVQAYSSAKDILNDHIFNRVVTNESQMSVLLFFDVFGNHKVIDRWNHGKDYEGFWASNDHHLDKQHTRSSHRSAVQYRHEVYDYQTNTFRPKGAPQTFTDGDLGGLPWEDAPAQKASFLDWDRVWNDSQETNDNVVALPNTVNSAIYRPTLKQTLGFKRIAERIIKSKSRKEEEMTGPIIKNLRVQRPTFCEMAKIADITEIGTLTERDLVELCDNYPGSMAQLIVELFHQNTRLDVQRKALGIKLEGLEKKGAK